MSGPIISLDTARLRWRDALDLDDPRYWDLDQRAYESLLRRAAVLDLRGLEFWWDNGGYCAGTIIGTEDDPEEGPVLVLDALETAKDGTDQNSRVALWEALSCGWLQEPGDEAEPWSDGYPATNRALARREARP
jgi:hypothetical protein